MTETGRSISESGRFLCDADNFGFDSVITLQRIFHPGKKAQKDGESPQIKAIPRRTAPKTAGTKWGSRLLGTQAKHRQKNCASPLLLHYSFYAVGGSILSTAVRLSNRAQPPVCPSVWMPLCRILWDKAEPSACLILPALRFVSAYGEKGHGSAPPKGLIWKKPLPAAKHPPICFSSPGKEINRISVKRRRSAAWHSARILRSSSPGARPMLPSTGTYLLPVYVRFTHGLDANARNTVKYSGHLHLAGTILSQKSVGFEFANEA